MSELAKKSVLVVEDHVITRLGLNLMLRERSDLRIVGEASDGREAIAMAVSLHPDVVLMDIGLPELDGIEAVWQIKRMVPGTRVLMLTSHDSRDDVLSAMGAGADGYCCKDIGLSELASAIDTVVSGGRWIDPRLSGANLLFEKSPPTPPKNVCEIKEGDRLATRLSFSEGNLELTSGSRFADKYVIEERLLSGERGLLYRAHNIHNGSAVAIKFLQDEYDFDLELLQSFCSESRALADFEHPNLVEVVEFGITNEGRPYLVMEYLGGNSLETILAAGVAIPVKRVVSIFCQVLSGLEAVHQCSRVHGDLRPANIITLPEPHSDRIKLSGCGLVTKRLSPVFRHGALKPFSEPFYMSPEHFSGGKPGLLSDIYSLAAVMYHAIYGVPVYCGQTYVEVCKKHLLDKPCFPPLTASGESMPFVLEDCLNRALSKKANGRFSSASEMRAELLTLGLEMWGESF